MKYLFSSHMGGCVCVFFFLSSFNGMRWGMTPCVISVEWVKNARVRRSGEWGAHGWRVCYANATTHTAGVVRLATAVGFKDSETVRFVCFFCAALLECMHNNEIVRVIYEIWAICIENGYEVGRQVYRLWDYICEKYDNGIEKRLGALCVCNLTPPGLFT